MPAFNFTISLNRNVLPAHLDYIAFMLIKIEPTPEAEQAVKVMPRRVHVVFTIDSSGSMAGEKIEVAKEAVRRRFRKDLGDEDLLSLVTFDNVAKVVLESVSKKSAEDFENKIRSITVGSLTNLYDGIKKSVEILKKTPQGYLRRVVLATDGIPTTGETAHDKIIELVKTARQEYNIMFDVYGIGSDYDYKLCEAIAKAGGGWMRHVEKAAELERLTKTSLDKYKGTVVDKLILSINLVNNVKLEDIIMTMPEIKKLDVEARMWDLGSLSVAQPIVVVARLRVGRGFPPGAHKIAEVQVGTDRKDVVVNFVSDESWMQEDPLVRYYYVISSNLAIIKEKLLNNQDTREDEKLLESLLNSQEARNLMLRDPLFAQIVAKYQKSKTIVDPRTKVDRITHVMD